VFELEGHRIWDVLGLSHERGVRDGWTKCGTWTV